MLLVATAGLGYVLAKSEQQDEGVREEGHQRRKHEDLEECNEVVNRLLVQDSAILHCTLDVVFHFIVNKLMHEK